MKKLSTVVFLLVVLFSIGGQAFGQCCPTPGPGNFPPELQAFLNLTDKQVGKINGMNQDFSNFLNSKFEEYIKIQQDFDVLSQAADIDAVRCELGGKYADIIKLNRAVDVEHTSVHERLMGILDEDQSQKLKFLERALGHQSEIYQALGANLLLYPSGPYKDSGTSPRQARSETAKQAVTPYQFFAEKLNW